MASVGSFSIGLTVDLKRFKAGISKAKKMAADAHKQIQAQAQNVGGAVNTAGAQQGPTQQATGGGGNKASKTAKEMSKASKQATSDVQRHTQAMRSNREAMVSSGSSMARWNPLAPPI